MPHVSMPSELSSRSGFSVGVAPAQDGIVQQRVAPFWWPLSIIAMVILIVTANFEYAAFGGQEVLGQLTGSTSSRQVAFLMLGSLGAFLLLRKTDGAKSPVWPVLFPALLLLLYVYMSALWSDEPTTTLKRAFVVTCIVLTGFGLGKCWDFKQFSQAIFVLSSLFLMISLGAELYYHAWLSQPDGYRFSGVFHPARQAFSCGMLALASLSLYFMDRKKLFLIVAAIAFAFVIATKARTGLAASVIAAGLLVWPYLSRRMLVMTGVFTACLTAALLILSGTTGKSVEVKSLATMGRDEVEADPSELTGRLPIWNHALGLFYQRPILGYGYGTFWTERRLSDFERGNGWAIAHSHSAYIESLVNLGIVGFLLGLWVVLITFSSSIHLSTTAVNPAARLVAALITMALVSGFAEMAFVGTGYEFLAIAAGVGLFAYAPVTDLKTHRNVLRDGFQTAPLNNAVFGQSSPSITETGS